MTQNSTSPNPQPPQASNQPQTPPTTLKALLEAPAAWNTIVADADGFEEQFTLRAATARELMRHVGEMKNHLKQKGYRPVPRKGQGASIITPANADEKAPLCAVHKTEMVKRNKDGR